MHLARTKACALFCSINQCLAWPSPFCSGTPFSFLPSNRFHSSFFQTFFSNNDSSSARLRFSLFISLSLSHLQILPLGRLFQPRALHSAVVLFVVIVHQSIQTNR